VVAPNVAAVAVSSPAWSPDGRTLYAVVGQGGFIDLYAFDAGGGASGEAAAATRGPGGLSGAQGAIAPPRALTRTQGGAFAPAPTPDGKALFYLSLEPYGLDLHRLDLGAWHTPPAPPTGLPAVNVPADLAPAVRPPAVVAPPLPSVGAAGFPVLAAPDAGASTVDPLSASPASSAPTAIGVPASRPYGAGRLELLPLIAGNAGSDGASLDLGVRGGDLIGRLDLLALGGFGSPDSPRGGTLAGSWRGWPVEVGAQAFDVREQPSRPSGPETPAAASGALDLERRGAGVDAAWDRRGVGDHLRLRLGLVWQTLDLAAGAAETTGAAGKPESTAGGTKSAGGAERIAGGTAREGMGIAEGSYLVYRRYGLWRLASNLGVRLAAGTVDGSGTMGTAGGSPGPSDQGIGAGTGGAGSSGSGNPGSPGSPVNSGGPGSWTRYGGDVAASVSRRDLRLAVSWRRDGSHGASRSFDLYQLGGAATGLLPAAVLASRLVSPALPVATLLGAEEESERVELTPGFLPFPLFWERHQLWGGPFLPHPEQVSLAGIEYRAALDPFPLVRLPALELRVGVARTFGAGAGAGAGERLPRDSTRWWLASVVRP
jgi:hypothetical protein